MLITNTYDVRVRVKVLKDQTPERLVFLNSGEDMEVDGDCITIFEVAPVSPKGIRLQEEADAQAEYERLEAENAILRASDDPFE